LDLLGASLSTGAGWDAAQVDLYVLRNNLPQALGLMADVVVRPDFPAREVARIRDERLTNLARARDEPTAIAANAYQSLVYGANHPYGRFATAEATRGIDRGQLVNFHRSFYRPGYATLVLAGDVDPETMHPMVERAFGGWQRGTGGTVAPVVTTTPTIGTTTIFLVDKPGAAQSEIRIGHPGVARDNPDYFPLLVLNTMLGGSFTSRLNTNLRETHGYSYGARSSFDMRRGAGPFTAQAAVVTAKTDSAVIEFFNELRRIRTEPIPEDELERAKRYVALGLPQRLETTSQVAGQLANLSVYGLDANFFEEYVPRVMAVTPEDLRRVANQHIRPDRSVVVVVGDRKTVEAGLRAIGLAPVEVRDVSHFVR
nr:insulinase family protein [Gemmatimonadota bacterium]